MGLPPKRWDDVSDARMNLHQRSSLSTQIKQGRLVWARFTTAALLTLAATVSAAAATRTDDPFQLFVDFESRYNSLNQDSQLFRLFTQTLGDFQTSAFSVRHLEIPLDDPKLPSLSRFTDWFAPAAVNHGPSWLVRDQGPDLPRYIHDAFFFEDSGRRWVRWPLYPGDETFGPQMRRYLSERGIAFREGHYFKGRKTASRSLILTDPKTGRSFSYKTSTDRTSQGQGGTQFRPVPIRWAHLTRVLSDLFHTEAPRLKHILVASEPLVLGLPELDTAFQVRLMEPMNSRLESGRPARYQISGLAIENRHGWRALLKLSKLSEDEMADRLVRAYIGAVTELQFVLGLRITSAHGQNIRFEFDHEFKPTGRAVILDFQDASPIAEVFLAKGEIGFLRNWARFVSATNRIHTVSSATENFLRTDPDIREALLQNGLTPEKAIRSDASLLQTGFLDLTEKSHPIGRRLENSVLMRELIKEVAGARLSELGVSRDLLRPRMGQGAWVASQGYHVLKPERFVQALQLAPARSVKGSGWRCLDLVNDTKWTRQTQYN
jgi:hypothetical protein